MNNAQPVTPPPDSEAATHTSSSEPEVSGQTETQPEARPEAHDAALNADISAPEDAGTAQRSVGGEPDPALASDEPAVETDTIAVAADNLTATADTEKAEDSIPDIGVDRTERAELTVTSEEEASGGQQETTDEAAPETVVPDSSVQQTGQDPESNLEQLPAGPQRHAEATESTSLLYAELLANISAGVEEQTDKLDRLSSALFAVDKRFSGLSASVEQLSQDLKKVSEETAQTINWTESVAITSSLSRWFLALSIFILIALLGGMGYLAVNQYQLMQSQSKASQAAATATELQIKRMAEFDKRFAELVGEAIKNERETISTESVAGKINKLRGGATERRILRKSTGDWLIPNGKTEELVTDPEIIEALNLSFEKSGRPLITPPSLPPHKTVCILKPDGKGGTTVMPTRETMP